MEILEILKIINLIPLMKKLLILNDKLFIMRINNKLDEIVYYLINLKPKEKTGLFTGSAGIALFLFYYSRYSRYKQNGSIADNAMEFLSHSVSEIDNDLYHTFCDGISGICWSIQHLIANGFIDNDNAEILEPFDRYLCDQVAYHSSIGNFDFLHGATGTAFYLLKRINNPLVRQTTEDMVNRLFHYKNEENSKYFWKSKFGNDINICLSHGISSICIYLCKVFGVSINKTISYDLLRKSISFLLSQENNSKERKSMFPTFNKDAISLNSRLGWCYGDLGIGMALWHYANAFNDNLMKEKSLDIFEFSSKRKDLTESFVIDAGICHGSAGIASIFKKMYYYTGLEEFKNIALYWLEQTLLMSKHEDGIIGYKSDEKDKSTDLLSGIAGIGLVLLSFLTGEETNWDECLLLS